MTKKKRRDSGEQHWAFWLLTVVLSVAILLLCRHFVTKDFTIFSDDGGGNYKAEVLTILDKPPAGSAAISDESILYFTCIMQSGPYKGQTVTAEQSLDDNLFSSTYLKPIEVGDSITLYLHESHDDPTNSAYSWYFSDYYRFDKIMILALVFAVLVLLIGQKQGLNTLLSLGLTFSFVFLVFVPAVMNGHNIYLAAAATCIYTIVMTLLLVVGPKKKALATIIGCISGTLIAAGVTAVMSLVLHLTGMVDEHSIYLAMLNPDKPMDLTALIFAAIIIGAMGAIMDVAMDISSSLFELAEQVPDISFRSLFQSGMRIGRDIMGTMANTLVLAYIGSSLCSIMLLLTYSTSMSHLLNREVIVVEFLQALTGSLAILLTIPVTVLVCGFLYLKHRIGGSHPGRRLA